jgi:SAM-dependent methyltransferase
MIETMDTPAPSERGLRDDPPRPCGRITASPNPLRVSKSSLTGPVTLAWDCRGVEIVEVRIGAPNGPLFSRGGPQGEAVTGNWVSDRMAFYLQAISGDAATTVDRVLIRVLQERAAGETLLVRAMDRLLGAAVFEWLERYLQRRNADPTVGRMRFGSLRRVTPISRVFGFDRGLPIDRFYIENFLAEHVGDIRGSVLEISDNLYTQTFGAGRVVTSDVLDLDQTPKTTIVGDLTKGANLPSNSYDCVILTQTLQLIYDLRAAIRTVHRILRPGGILLATVPGISQTTDEVSGSLWCWGFTPRSAKLLLDEFFPQGSVETRSYGNVLSAVAFLHGLAAGELTAVELNHYEPGYDVTIAIRAMKAAGEKGLGNEHWS